ncbi:MAG: hypothetical protein LBN96_06220 [Desulfovibrio sp.]|jgi:hypothetical protein|nr:hypothetical protein [Desulfovibrio sp.]
MSFMSKMPSKIRYSFRLEPKARLQTAHGVWGGVNSQGEIEMNFYYESEALPPFVEQIVEPDGALGSEFIPEDEELREVTRHIHTRVLLSYNTARGVLEWLEEQLDALEEEGRAMYDGSEPGVTQ